MKGRGRQVRRAQERDVEDIVVRYTVGAEGGKKGRGRQARRVGPGKGRGGYCIVFGKGRRGGRETRRVDRRKPYLTVKQRGKHRGKYFDLTQSRRSQIKRG